MSNTAKKWICFASIAAMTTMSLAGCKQKNNPDDVSDTAKSEVMGRYVESDVSLPDSKIHYIQTYITDDGKLALIAVNDSKETLDYFRYIYQEDGSWEKETIAELPCEDPSATFRKEYRVGKNGEEYIYFITSKEQSNYGNLFRHVNDSWEPLTIDGWNEYDEEYKYYKAPTDFGVLDDGTIIASIETDLTIYNPDTGKVEKNLDYSMDNGYNNYHYLGNNIVFDQIDLSTDQPKNLCKYNAGNDTMQEIPYPNFNEDSSNLYYMDGTSEDLYAINSNGIQIYQDGTSIWQTIVDGSLTSLYLPTMGVISFTSTPQNDYYILCYIDEDMHLLQYHYDETVAAVPNVELTIYSLTDNPLVRQAIVFFQHNHPDVRVSLNAVMTNATDVNVNDYIRSLNTSLLAGGGEDILILDGLPYQDFQEKGVLTDLTDTIQPMLDSGELLSNIITPFVQDGKYYYAPTKMKLMMEYGNGDAATKCTSIDDVIEYAKSHTDRPILGEITSSSLIDTFLPVYLSSLTNEDGSLSEADVKGFFEKLKELFDLTDGVSVIADPDKASETYTSMFDLPAHTTMFFSDSSGFMDETFNLAVVDYVNGSFNNFEHSFKPVGIIGINNNSKKIDLAKEFVQMLYTEEVQKLDFLDGYSVNSAIVDRLIDATFDGAYTEIEDANGNYVPFSVLTPSNEMKQKLVDLCKSAANCITPDDTVLLNVASAAENYLAGNVTLDNAVSDLMNQLSLYNKEQ